MGFLLRPVLAIEEDKVANIIGEERPSPFDCEGQLLRITESASPQLDNVPGVEPSLSKSLGEQRSNVFIEQ